MFFIILYFLLILLGECQVIQNVVCSNKIQKVENWKKYQIFLSVFPQLQTFHLAVSWFNWDGVISNNRFIRISYKKSSRFCS